MGTMIAVVGERVGKSFVIFAVIMGLYVSTMSVLRFGYFLSGSGDVPSGHLPFDFRVYFRIFENWTLAYSYLYLPSIVECTVQKIGKLYGLPECYFRFTKIVLLALILNGVIILWQAVPEICLWHVNINYAENIQFYLHCSMWSIVLMMMLAIDIIELTGLKSIMYYHLTNGNCISSFKSRQFDRFLSNMGIPGSSCLIVILWAQKVMSFDKFVLAVIWTFGILSCNQTDDKDIKYVAKQIERKKAWMYYSQKITVSPLK